jgi:hypothetical protein
MKKILIAILFMLVGAYLTALGIGLWNRFDNENWSYLVLGMLLFLPLIIAIDELDSL